MHRRHEQSLSDSKLAFIFSSWGFGENLKVEVGGQNSARAAQGAVRLRLESSATRRDGRRFSSTTMSTTSSDLTVSLEPHLKDALTPLISLLPQDLSNELSQELNKTEIRYGTVADISKWCRSDEGAAALKARGMHPTSYSTVSLLAGTKTSPSSKLPPPIPPESAEQKSRREWGDRKALTAVLNGLLSVGCSGGAAWWAADKSGWRDEWVSIQLSHWIRSNG